LLCCQCFYVHVICFIDDDDEINVDLFKFTIETDIDTTTAYNETTKTSIRVCVALTIIDNTVGRSTSV